MKKCNHTARRSDPANYARRRQNDSISVSNILVFDIRVCTEMADHVE